MKEVLTKTTLLMIFLSASPYAIAADLISCKTEEGEQSAALRVYESEKGYSYELTTCQQGSCVSRTGPIRRNTYKFGDNEFPSLVFNKGGEISVVHLFGEYSVGTKDGVIISFPDQGCLVNRGNDFVTQGAYLDPRACGVGEPIAKDKARANAEQKCGSQNVLQVDDFEIVKSCENNRFLVSVSAIFRCLE